MAGEVADPDRLEARPENVRLDRPGGCAPDERDLAVRLVHHPESLERMRRRELLAHRRRIAHLRRRQAREGTLVAAKRVSPPAVPMIERALRDALGRPGRRHRQTDSDENAGEE